MSTQPNQGNTIDQNNYGGYGGYHPRKPADDPYGASSPQGESSSGTSSAQDSSRGGDPHYVYGQQCQQYTSSSNQQQQQAYMPPGSVTGRKSRPSWSPRRFLSNLKPNQAAFFSYLLGFVGGIFFLFYERNNRLVRFSASQSIVLFLPLFIIIGILNFLVDAVSSLIVIGFLLAFPLSAINFLLVTVGMVLWLVLMLRAYQGRELKLPVVGDYAERLLGLFAPRKRKN